MRSRVVEVEVRALALSEVLGRLSAGADSGNAVAVVGRFRLLLPSFDEIAHEDWGELCGHRIDMGE